MATIAGANSLMPLNELANRLDRSGGTAEMAFHFMEKNQFLEVLPFRQSSHETHHEFVKTLAIPQGEWTQVNKGVDIERSTTAPVTEYMGTLESYSQIDVRAFRGMKRSAAAAIRLQEDRGFMTGMSQTVSKAIFYESQANEPKAFDGIFPRDTYSSLSSDQVIGAGGSNNVMSVIVAEFGDETIYGIIPKDTKAGMESEDLGREAKYDSDDKRFDVFTTHFIWTLGLTIKDEKALVRIANLDDDTTDTGFKDIEDHIIHGFSLLPNMGNKNTYIFTNRNGLRHIQTIAKDRVNVTYDPSNPWGRKWILDFMGSPIKIDEQLKTDEDAVT